MTGSKKLVTLLNKFGHCATYIEILRIECAMANTVLNSYRTMGAYVPSHLEHGKFVFSAIDNIDFSEGTPDGKNTTHGTNMIMFQPDNEKSMPQVIPLSSSTKQLSLSGDQLYSYIHPVFISPDKLNVVPEPSQVDSSYVTAAAPLVDTCCQANASWVAIRSQDINTPTWYAYNARKQLHSPCPTTLAYLPMLNEPSTQLSTVFKCIKIIQNNSFYLGQSYPVIFMDQAMYAKAKELTMANQNIFPNAVLMMGGFHLHMNFLSAVGSFVAGLGWSDLLQAAGVFNQTIVTNLLNAKPYSRCLAAHMAFYEALTVLKSEATESGLVQKDSSLYQFWTQYLYLIDLALTQLFAERTGNWALYLQTITAMAPLFFATDKQNYARWLSVHTHDMVSLPKRCPKVYGQFMKGNFVVNRTKNHYSAVPPDMALEQTLNRDVKCQGGLVGKANKDSARDKWYLTSHFKATIAADLFDRVGSENASSHNHHTDNDYDQKKSKDLPTLILEELKERDLNPFSKCGDKLLNMVTGMRYTKEETAAVLGALEIGSENYLQFVKKRLESQNVAIKERIPRLKVPFLLPQKSKVSVTMTQAKSQCKISEEKASILGRLLVASTNSDARNIDISALLSSLESYPLAIAQENGNLLKTDKAQLKLVLNSQLPEGRGVQMRSIRDNEEESTSLILDGMAFIHHFRPISNAISFGEYAEYLFRTIVRKMCAEKASRCDIIFDRYEQNSIKALERRRRANGTQPSIKITSQKSKVPKDWASYLLVEANKVDLIEYIVTIFKKKTFNLQPNQLVVVSSSTGTTSISYHGVIAMDHLNNNHEEADTMTILHLKNHIHSVYKTVVVEADDTDVLVLITHFLHKWQRNSVEVWFHSKQSYIPVHKLSSVIGDKARLLIGLHSLTGCDTTSSFYGVSKSKAYKKMTDDLENIGIAEYVDATLLIPFVYALYGIEEFEGNLDQLRYKLFCEKGVQGKRLPPDDANFKLHCSRANLQAFIWNQADKNDIYRPDPAQHGWNLDEGVGYFPAYHKHENVQHVINSCKCKGNCSTSKCSCKRAAKDCSDLCSCTESCNNHND